MTDLIVFSVANNRYALNIENIQRIIEAPVLTDIPNAHPLIDGMMSHEDSVIKILSFRKLTGLVSYKTELKELFITLKESHKVWIKELELALTTGSEFSKTTNPHVCELGVWIDAFTSYDNTVASVYKELLEYHKMLHTRGGDALEVYEKDKARALSIYKDEIKSIYTHTIGALESFINKLDIVANSLQKLIIYENNNSVFAIKVDKIEDIAHIEDSQVIYSGDDEQKNEFLELDGILDIDSVLINVIKSIKIPK